MLTRVRNAAVPAVAVFTLALSTQAFAQTAIPVRTLGPALASSRDTVGTLVVIRSLSDGRMLVNDIGRARVLMFDASLGAPRVVVDTAGGSLPTSPVRVPLHAATLIRYLGDSTLYPDRSSQSLLVLDGNGKVARVMALPKPQDMLYIAGGGEAGLPGVDSKGRLIYHGVYRPKPRTPDPLHPTNDIVPTQPDSSPIVRGDFDTRRVDTLAALKLNIGAPFVRRDVDDQGNVTMHYAVNLLDTDDQWAMLSDGTVAVVSVQDYHIEFTDPDGTHRSSGKLPFDWKPYTAAQKRFTMDSLKPELDKLNEAPTRTINTPAGPRQLRTQYSFVPPEKLGDYEHPIESGAVKTDLKAQLWMVPRTSLGGQDGLLYDVVNRDGKLTERVKFPKNYVLAGFGAKDDVYVLRVDGKAGFLERRQVMDVRRQ